MNIGLALVVAAVAGCLSLLLLAAPAHAAFEEVGCFAGAPMKPGGPASEACKPVAGEKFSEEVQLGGVGGMAVNYTGTGGVAKGTVYAVSETSTQSKLVSMYGPRAGGGLEFLLGWRVTIFGGPYEHCGPALGVDGEGKAEHPCAPRAEALPKAMDVEVDQETGNVYVYIGAEAVGSDAIVAYSSEGLEITRFGEIAPSGKTTAETPGQIHESPFPGAIAVNGAGEVYVFDLNNSDNFYHRLMKFQPVTPGDPSAYEYAGSGKDVAAKFGPEGPAPRQPVADAAGNLYTVAESSLIEMFDPATPSAGPVCTFQYAPGGVTGMTVDPASGRVFFFSYKPPKRIHELGPCNPGSEKFGETVGGEFREEVGQIEVSPERGDLWAMAFDPADAFSPTREAGVLFGGAPEPKSPVVGAGEPGQSSLGYIFAPPEEVPPTVGEESVAGVTATSARLRAIVNPKNFRTTYSFEYLTAADYEAASKEFTGATAIPSGGGEAGEGKVAVAVGASATGLVPDTEYRYRAVARNEGCPANPGELCETVGPVQSFRTYPVGTAGLPDGRAWELVSPANKNGGQVFPANASIYNPTCDGCKPGLSQARYPMQSAPGGDAVAYEGTAFSPTAGASSENEYLTRRGSSGWQTGTLAPSLMSSGSDRGYTALSTDLDRGIIRQQRTALSPQAPPEYTNLYAQELPDPFALTPLVTAAATFHRPPTSTGQFELSYNGGATDLSHVFFTANDALTGEVPGIAPSAPEVGAGESNLYEWDAASQELRLVNVLPGNASASPDASFAGPGSAHAISADGKVAFWSDTAGHLYARLDATRTLEVPGTSSTVKFLSASADGSRVLLSDGHLYELNPEETAYLLAADLSAGKGGFLGLVGESEDLSRLYYTDTKNLTVGEEVCREGTAEVEEVCEEAKEGKPNLYTWDEGQPHYIATLLARDNAGAAFGSIGVSRDWAPAPSDRTAEASPDGEFLAFLSGVSLNGYDNTGPCEVIQSGPPTIYGPGPCAEAFVYDAESSELRCASCNPANASPLGWTQLPLLEGPDALPQTRYLSDSGRLFFNSADSLSPQDTNEGVEDVYQWEPSGVGGCNRAGGCLSLISAGREGVDSDFVAMSANGSDVFFTTRDRLVGADTDGLIDLYDAREPHLPGEAVGFVEALPPGGGCQGESCQPPPPPAAEAPPASSTFAGSGNVKQGGCKKGFVKRKGKCVKPNKKAKKQKKAKHSGRNGGSK